MCIKDGTYFMPPHITLPTGKPGTLLLHRLLTGAPAAPQVDHHNGNGLDDTDTNMHVCSHGDNQRNKPRLLSSNSSGFNATAASLSKMHDRPRPRNRMAYASDAIIQGRDKGDAQHQERSHGSCDSTMVRWVQDMTPSIGR
jgi:hypothetical protein